MIDPAILASAVKRAKDELPCIPDEETEAKVQIEALIAAGEAWLENYTGSPSAPHPPSFATKDTTK